jgi:hypothetical protein
MECQARYIIKYNGNYERWYAGGNLDNQKRYRNEIKKIKARFVEDFKKQSK